MATGSGRDSARYHSGLGDHRDREWEARGSIIHPMTFPAKRFSDLLGLALRLTEMATGSGPRDGIRRAVTRDLMVASQVAQPYQLSPVSLRAMASRFWRWTICAGLLDPPQPVLLDCFMKTITFGFWSGVLPALRIAAPCLIAWWYASTGCTYLQRRL
jgi:hypothetical protein